MGPFNEYSAYGIRHSLDGYMMDDTLAGLAPGGFSLGAGPASLLGSALNFGSQALLMKMENNEQERFYNSYLSPKAKMRQMREAGINPSAAAQGIAGGSFGQMNAASAGAGSAPGLANTLGTLTQNQPLTEADVRLKDAQAHQAETQAKVFDKQAEGLGIENQYKPETLQSIIEMNRQSGRISKETADYLEKKNEYVEDFVKADLSVLQSTAKELDKRIAKYREEIELMKTQEGLNAAESRQANAQAAYQEWINEFCEQNGWKPDGPEAQYLSLKAQGKDKEAEDLLKGLGILQREFKRGETLGQSDVLDPWAVDVYDLRSNQRELRESISRQKAVIEDINEAVYDALHHGDVQLARDLGKLKKDALSLCDAMENSQISDREYAKRIHKFNEAHGYMSYGKQFLKAIGPSVATAVGIAVGGKAAGKAAGSRIPTKAKNYSGKIVAPLPQ